MNLTLTNSNAHVIVDDAVYPILSKYNWSTNNFGYVRAWIPSRKREFYIHRLLLNARENQEVDHINGNKLDNRRENLRFVTRKQNMWNMAHIAKGYSWHSSSRKWQAQIKRNNKAYYLGTFATEAEARQAYINAVNKFNQAP